MSTIRQLKGTALSPDQLKNYYKEQTGETLKVIMLNQVNPNDTINEIFSHGCLVLFIPVMSSYNGHFVSLFRTKQGIYFLDSYANTPKGLFETIEDLGKVHLKTHLFEIIRKSGENVYNNTILYQSKTEDIADCGRFAVINCILFTKFKRVNKIYDLNIFNNKLIEFMKENNLKDYDDAIVYLTSGLS